MRFTILGCGSSLGSPWINGNWGNCDKDNLKKEAIKYLDIFKDHPYIFNLGHGILPETDPSMMDYLVKTIKDY